MKNLVTRTLTAALVLASIGLAGTNGICPAPGTYDFWRTSQNPAQSVGAGKFGNSGNLRTNPLSGPDEKWAKNANGSYQLTPIADIRRICILVSPTGVPAYFWEYKVDGMVVASGDLNP
jgi:hypothetical protein